MGNMIKKIIKYIVCLNILGIIIAIFREATDSIWMTYLLEYSIPILICVMLYDIWKSIQNKYIKGKYSFYARIFVAEIILLLIFAVIWVPHVDFEKLHLIPVNIISYTTFIMMYDISRFILTINVKLAFYLRYGAIAGAIFVFLLNINELFW